MALSMCLALTSSPASAYVVSGCKYGGSNPTIYYVTSNLVTSGLGSAVSAGAGRWNSVSVPGVFAAYSGSGLNKVTFSEFSFANPDTVAQFEASCYLGLWQSNQTAITWSSEWAATYGATQLRIMNSRFLGRSYGLEFNSSSSCSDTKTVMAAYRYLLWNCSWGTEPWQDDINGVNAIY